MIFVLYFALGNGTGAIGWAFITTIPSSIISAFFNGFFLKFFETRLRSFEPRVQFSVHFMVLLEKVPFSVHFTMVLQEKSP